MYYNPDTKQFEFEVGDEAWIVPGYYGNYLLAIKVKIIHVDDSFRKEKPQNYLFYHVDEPYIYPIPGDELFSEREAKDELNKRYEIELADGEVEINADLTKYREEVLSFIEDSQEENNMGQALDADPIVYPDLKWKELGKDWFNVRELRYGGI